MNYFLKSYMTAVCPFCPTYTMCRPHVALPFLNQLIKSLKNTPKEEFQTLSSVPFHTRRMYFIRVMWSVWNNVFMRIFAWVECRAGVLSELKILLMLGTEYCGFRYNNILLFWTLLWCYMVWTRLQSFWQMLSHLYLVVKIRALSLVLLLVGTH